MSTAKEIRALDVTCTPQEWITVKEAAHKYASGEIVCDLGAHEFVLNGGIQCATGLRSQIRVNSIIMVSGKSFIVSHYDRVPGLNKKMLLRRDRFVCAYCGDVFKEENLEMEHIIPDSRGGPASWMNLVAACSYCNDRKGARTPEEAKMPLLYVPYVPNRHEAFILNSRRILADQMEFLLEGVPKHSRLRHAN
jgi:5-methylcytosine-specific restriction endonuclease McrA